MHSRDGSIEVMHLAHQPGQGGSTPTPSLGRREWRVRHVSIDAARDLVGRFHYGKGGSNTAVYVFGVLPAGSIFEAEAIAASWWIPPTRQCAANVWPTDWRGVLSLSRLVCVPKAPKNTASFLLGWSVRQIDPRRWPVLITFADEWQGHTGAIYKAAGWLECGKTKPERTYRLDGRMIARKAGQRTRTHAEMMAMGCELVGSFCRRRFVHVRSDLRDQFKLIHRRLMEQ